MPWRQFLGECSCRFTTAIRKQITLEFKNGNLKLLKLIQLNAFDSKFLFSHYVLLAFRFLFIH